MDVPLKVPYVRLVQTCGIEIEIGQLSVVAYVEVVESMASPGATRSSWSP
jgi:hypothetical protein